MPGWTLRSDDMWENANCSFVCFCFPVLGVGVPLNSRSLSIVQTLKLLHGYFLERSRGDYLLNWSSCIFGVCLRMSSLVSLKLKSFLSTHTQKSSSVPRTGSVQKAARKNLMSVIIVNRNKIWGKEEEKKRGKNLLKSYLSLIRRGRLWRNLFCLKWLFRELEDVAWRFRASWFMSCSPPWNRTGKSWTQVCCWLFGDWI